MFLEGQEFPGDQHRERIKRYAQHRKMLRGLYDAAMGIEAMVNATGSSDYLLDLRRDEMRKLVGEVRVIANLPRVIARRLAGMATRGLTFKAREETQTQTIQDVLKASRWSRLRRQMCYRMLIYGNGVASVRKERDKQIFVDARDPWTWFPTADLYDPAEATEHTFAWAVRRGDAEFLLQEVHRPGEILRTANELRAVTKSYMGGTTDELVRDTKVGARVDWTEFYPDLREVEKTSVDEPLVVYMQAWTDEETIYGDSLLLGNESLVFELTARLSQIANVLDKHAEPKLQGPDSGMARDPHTGQSSFSVTSSFFPIEPGDAQYSYLSWEAQLEHAQKAIDRVVSLICIQMDMSPELLGLNLSGGAGVEATDTLRIRSFSTLAGIEDQRAFMLDSMQTLGRLILRLDGWQSVDSPEVVFGDPLPVSAKERSEQILADRRAGVVSMETAVQRANPDMDADELKAEVERIRNEEASMFNPGIA